MKCMRRIAFHLLALVFFCLDSASLPAATCTWKGGTGYWFDDANWTNGYPRGGDDGVVYGGTIKLTNETAQLGTLTISGGTISFSNWLTRLVATNIIMNGGTLTTAGGFTTAQESNRVWLVCTNLFIASGATINVNALGYLGGALLANSGYGQGGGTTRVGAAYGGFGGNYEFYSPEPYGTEAAPEMPGSGGGGVTGGNGGGPVRIEAGGGTVTVNGLITANGGNGGGGGSGGGIWVTCQTLAGTSGTIRANGGTSSYGGGGGGRIAIDYDTASQAAAPKPSIVFAAMPLAGSTYTGDLGSIYFTDTCLLSSLITNLYGVLAFASATNWAVESLTVSNAWVRFPANGFLLGVTQDVTVVGSGHLELGGNAVMRADCVRDYSSKGRMIYSSTAPGPFLECGGNVVVSNNARLTVYAGATNETTAIYGALMAVTGDVTIEAAGTLAAVANPTNGGGVCIRTGNLKVNSGGILTADQHGYAGGPTYEGTSTTTGRGPGGGGFRTGGTHGSWSEDFQLAATRPQPYGSTTNPLTSGSGGGGRQTDYSRGGGSGGGLIWVEATGTVTVHGVVSANSGVGTTSGGGGGINIACKVLAGANGIISANAASGAYYSGSGGRIALRYDPTAQSNAPPPVLVVSANCANKTNADIGTIYLADAQLLGALITNWNGQLIFPATVTNWVAPELTLRNSRLRFRQSGFQINILTNFTLDSASQFELGGNTYFTTRYTISKDNLYPLLAYSALSTAQVLQVGGDLLLTNQSKLLVYPTYTNADVGPHGAYVTVGGTLELGSNCWIHPHSQPTNGGSLLIRANRVVIAPFAGINAANKGYAGSLSATQSGFGPGFASVIRTGGTHGGKGGLAGNAPATYGNTNAPAQAGSGGSREGATGGIQSGHGGAVVRLEVTGDILFDGTISADGGDSTSDSLSYEVAGAGGSVFLICNMLQGTGTISADGGDATGGSISASGGGGRVAVWYGALNAFQTNQLHSGLNVPGLLTNVPSAFSGSATAMGGVSSGGATGLWHGAAGTVVWWGSLARSGSIIMFY